MSLLLKALQKAESERQQQQLAFTPLPQATEQAASLGTAVARPSAYQPAFLGQPHGGNTIINTGGNSSAWIAVVLGCNMMFIAALAFLWFHYQQTDSSANGLPHTQAAHQTPAWATTTDLLAPVEQSLAQSLQNKVLAARETLNQSAPQQPPAARVVPEQAPATIVRLEPAQPTPLPKVPQTKPEPAPESLLGAGSDALYQMQDLNPQMQSEFPKLHYNAHLYTPNLPDARMFMANDIRYGEQDIIDNNTKVEAIVPEGVIFNFKGLRVKVNVVDKLQ